MSHFFYRKAWLVTGQSKEIIDEIQKQIPSRRLHYLSNGVDLGSFHPNKRDKGIRARYLKDGEVGFIYAGLHGFFQGLEQIILCADRVRGEPVRFLLFGDGSEKEAIMKMASDLGLTNVDFHPPMPHDRIPSIVASMDVAVIPLRTTIPGSVPSKIYEAMASSVPVLLVANGEAREIVEKAGAGVAVDPGNIDQFARAVRELTRQPEWRGRMGQSGRRATEAFFDRAKIIRTFETALTGK
jgi:glycosyltransferase involved in cell wall biosynthesis